MSVPFILALVPLLAIAALLDLRQRRIPNWVAAAVGLLGGVALAATAPAALWQHALVALLMLVVGIAIWSRGWLGGGDVKLLAALGLWAGPDHVSSLLLATTLAITHAGLVRDFGIAAPRIAVAGLNPHAGEGGLIGREDIDLITPVLEVARARGMTVLGPLSADTLFHAEARADYDAALAMYHDQALIPIKTLSFDTGVNLTLGLPFVRTSPDHGTAYALAGTGKARPESFIAALRLADEIATRRSATGHAS